MGDKKKTFSKLGKFFGVLATNLSQLDETNGSNTEVLLAPGLGAAPSWTPLVKDEDLILAQQENDDVTTIHHNSQSHNNHTQAKHTQNTNSSASSPKLASSSSHTPVNHPNISSTTTSPLLISSEKDSTSSTTAVTINLPPPDINKILQPMPHSINDTNLNRLNLSSTSNTNVTTATTNKSNDKDKMNNISSFTPPDAGFSLSPTSTALHSQIPPLVNRRTSPSVSRSSSTNVPRKHANTISAPGAMKVAPISRSASTKNNNNHNSNASSTDLSMTSSSPAVAKPRFRMLQDGNHEHSLRSAKRQEKLSNMLKDLLGAKKLRDEAKSAVPNILQGAGAAPSPVPGKEKPPTLFAGLVTHIKNNTSPYHTSAGEIVGEVVQQNGYSPNLGDCRSFVEKYGRCQEVVGRGAFGVVRISHKKLNGTETNGGGDGEMLYAVKEFKRRPNESEKKYNRRLTSEFCISSSLKHLNIIDTLDLLKDAKGDYCEVMEFCSGGDLYTLIIAAGKLEYAEADCFFKQIIRGVNYMHDMGVCHRDLKPENLLLTQNGVIKITDFGNGECFRVAWENEIQLSEGICGSSPYIAPEEFTQESFDPRCVDIWACGVIYMAMRTGRQLWKLADPDKDEFFEEYLVKRKESSGYEPIESLKRARCRNVIYSILDPKPERRITGKQILNSEWGREIKVCAAGEGHSS